VPERNVFLLDLSLQPAIKLIDYIYRMYGSGRKISAFATGVAQRISPTMRELDPLSSADAALWVDYWAPVGMFQWTSKPGSFPVFIEQQVYNRHLDI
jgi:hypothetical protein